MKVITWNMQGGNASTENKWNAGVYPLFTEQPDVVCLQECGAVPSSAQLHTATYGGVAAGLDLYTWGGTSWRPGLWILFYPATPGHTARCNLALVSRTQPGVPMLLSPAAPPTWRPVLGAPIGNRTVFTLHAISPNGPDTRGLLRQIAAAFPPANNNNNNNNNGNAPAWVVAGDFNRPPDGTFPGFRQNDVDANRWALCAPNGDTHHSYDPSTKKDYAVKPDGPGVLGTVLSLVMSDHLPVSFVV